eukprot:3495515-Amphidinium_carterae.1
MCESQRALSLKGSYVRVARDPQNLTSALMVVIATLRVSSKCRTVCAIDIQEVGQHDKVYNEEFVSDFELRVQLRALHWSIANFTPGSSGFQPNTTEESRCSPVTALSLLANVDLELHGHHKSPSTFFNKFPLATKTTPKTV